MARHLRLEHTFCQCVWRCPVASCPSWFASEFDGKDHLEETHLFSEGNGCSLYYECFGLEWFGRRSFFDRSRTSGQALWMDIALARKSGQELHNEYVITDSPAFDELRLFFHAAVRELLNAYFTFPRSGDHTLFTLVQKGDAGFAELLESTMIARPDIHQGRTMRTISRKQKVCSSRGDTSFQRGQWLLFILRMLWIGMVWPSLVLRPKQNFRPSFMDGHCTRTEIRTGTTQRVCDHRQPGV